MNMNPVVCSPDSDIGFFDIVICVLQEDTLAPDLFITYLNDILWMSIDLIKENVFTFKKKNNRWYPAESMTDTDCVDYLALLQIHLHSLDQALYECK